MKGADKSQGSLGRCLWVKMEKSGNMAQLAVYALASACSTTGTSMVVAPVISARRRQEDPKFSVILRHRKFKASLGFISPVSK